MYYLTLEVMSKVVPGCTWKETNVAARDIFIMVEKVTGQACALVAAALALAIHAREVSKVDLDAKWIMTALNRGLLCSNNMRASDLEAIHAQHIVPLKLIQLRQKIKIFLSSKVEPRVFLGFLVSHLLRLNQARQLLKRFKTHLNEHKSLNYETVLTHLYISGTFDTLHNFCILLNTFSYMVSNLQRQSA